MVGIDGWMVGWIRRTEHNVWTSHMCNTACLGAPVTPAVIQMYECFPYDVAINYVYLLMINSGPRRSCVELAR